jgi:hypothetical protein
MKKKLTLNKNNASISERMEELYRLWDIDINETRNTLRKMYYSEFDYLKSIKEKRLVLHNLVCAEMEAENGITNSSKLWANTLVEFLENEPDYIEINVEEYAKAINNYVYTHKDILSKEKLILAHEKYCKIFEGYEYIEGGDLNDLKRYLEKMNAKLNLFLIKKNYNMVLEIFKDVLIHNDNNDCETMINYMIKDVEEADIELHKQVLLLKQNYCKQIICKVS